MIIEQLKKDLNIKDKDIAELFGLKPMTYANSTAKKRYETALIKFYELLKARQKIL